MFCLKTSCGRYYVRYRIIQIKKLIFIILGKIFQNGQIFQVMKILFKVDLIMNFIYIVNILTKVDNSKDY